MTKKFKTRLFVFLCFIFVIIGTLAVVYSRGFKLVFSDECSIRNIFKCDFKIQKNGGIYLETKPKGVVIKIDGKEFGDESGLVQGGTLIKGLSPKYHKVEIAKTGYYPWQKRLKVLPEKVTEAVDILLVPQPVEPKETPFLRLRGEKIIGAENGRFLIKDSASGNYYLYEENNLNSALNINTSFANLKRAMIRNVTFHPYDANKLVVENETGLDIFDFVKLKIEVITRPKPLAWTAKGSTVYFVEYVTFPVVGSETLKSEYRLSSFNLIMKKKAVLFSLPFDKKTAFVGLEASNSQDKFAVLDSAGNLYLFDNGKKSFDRLAEDVRGVSYSPDSEKLAFWQNNKAEVDVYFLKDWQDGLRKKAGETIPLDLSVWSNGDIKSVYWHKDSFHIFVETASGNAGKNDLIFSEVDDRLPLNYYRLFSAGEDFEYNYKSEKLYFISDGRFWQREI